MAIKHIKFRSTDGRDAGKEFLITEMPARAAHKWATRALLALINGGVDIPEDVASMGMAAIASMGSRVLTSIPVETAEPLLDELLACVEIVPDPSKPNVTRKLFDEDVEEFVTYFKLQKEAFLLHVDFLKPGSISTSARAEEASRT